MTLRRCLIAVFAFVLLVFAACGSESVDDLSYVTMISARIDIFEVYGLGGSVRLQESTEDYIFEISFVGSDFDIPQLKGLRGLPKVRCLLALH